LNFELTQAIKAKLIKRRVYLLHVQVKTF